MCREGVHFHWVPYAAHAPVHLERPTRKAGAVGGHEHAKVALVFHGSRHDQHRVVPGSNDLLVRQAMLATLEVAANLGSQAGPRCVAVGGHVLGRAARLGCETDRADKAHAEIVKLSRELHARVVRVRHEHAPMVALVVGSEAGALEHDGYHLSSGGPTSNLELELHNPQA